MKRRVVTGLGRACALSHPVFHRRPFLWFGPACKLATLSDRLDQRWGTGCWREAD